MGRKRKPFKRPPKKLDCRLIVITSEGSNTEVNYFRTLAEEYDKTNVHVKIIPSKETKSDPAHVFERLDDFYRNYDLGEDDNLYLVVDRDRWDEGCLSDIAATCNQKGFFMTLSNPNFELWLLLHEKDISNESNDEKERIFQNDKINKNRRYIGKLLSSLWNGYNKSNCNFEHIMGKVQEAIKNGRTLDTQPQERWPNSLATRVYIPAEDIIK